MEAYIVAATRTAGGRKGGRLAGWHPADLGGAVLDELVERTGVDPALIEDVVMGCVMQVGEQCGNIARNAVLASRLPESVPATSVDRQCGSSQQALHFAAQAVMCGPWTGHRGGRRGHDPRADGPLLGAPVQEGFGKNKSPRMEDRYPGIEFSQFTGAEMMAVKYGLATMRSMTFGYRSHARPPRPPRPAPSRRDRAAGDQRRRATDPPRQRRGHPLQRHPPAMAA